MASAGASPARQSKSPKSKLSSQRQHDTSRTDTFNVIGSQSQDPKDADLPNINERLGQLRPSKELLEFYRKKIAEYDEEHEHLVSKLDEYKVTYEDQHKVHWELRQREEEIVELQKALSDMQVYLFQEREHVLRLYAENDRLKIRELEDKKKIAQLLDLGTTTTEGEVTYFMKEPPAKAIVEQRVPNRPKSSLTAPSRQGRPGKKTDRSGGGERRQSLSPDPERQAAQSSVSLSLTVESLQAQMEEQARLAKEQYAALVEDLRVKEEESHTRQLRDEEKIKVLTEKLHKTQDLLYESTRDFLELRYQGRALERQWMAEKDQLLRRLDAAKERQAASQTGPRDQTLLNLSVASMAEKEHAQEEIKSLEYQLQQSQKMADMYREQVIQLEDELARIREEGDVTREIFKGRSDKMAKRLQLMNSRYQDLERRRNLEVEGFKNDIKNLRARLKDVERQLYKVTLGFTEDMDLQRPDELDMQILKNVRRTAGRSQKMYGELKNLKAKVYSMENDLKHL